MSLNNPKRMTLMKWHGYLSVFFLTLMLIYAATGTLYLFEYEGNKASRSITVEIAVWPSDEQQARLLMPALLEQVGEDKLPPNYSSRKGHEWYGFTKSIAITQEAKPVPATVNGHEKTSVQVTVKTPDFMRKMLMIHKGKAGPVFTVLGVAVGIYTLLMLITGVWLTLRTKPMHQGSMVAAAIGLVTVIVSYLIASS